MTSSVVPPSVEGLEPGAVLNGRYRLERSLGQGGMAVLYEARDLQVMSRSVVIKCLLTPSEGAEWSLRKFRQEIEALARLRHPGIVEVLDQGSTSSGRPYFVMQLVEGLSLRERLNQGPVPLETAATLLRQLGHALTAAHDAGIVHRDLKPENVMLQSLGYDELQVRLIDFGLAHVEHSISAPQASAAMLVGTLAYMAPEQLTGGAASPQSDLYSLAVLACELVTGVPPHRPTSFFELLALQRRPPAKLPGELRPELSPESERLLLAGLSCEPAQRPMRARDFTDALSLALQADHARYSLPHRGETPPSAEPKTTRPVGMPALESPGGAVPLASPFYLERPADRGLTMALERRDSIVLIKGARQVGKTSLLARGLQHARQNKTLVVTTDFQQLEAGDFLSADTLLRALAGSIADQLELDIDISTQWSALRGANQNLERFLRRTVLSTGMTLVWGMDEVDRLFTCPFGSSIFGLFRSWHNRRALEPEGPWHRLTLIITYATEAHLFITDLNQSPFNVGTRLELEDFTLEQVELLNQRHGSPIQSGDEVARLMGLVGGHPYLIRRALFLLSQEREGFSPDGHDPNAPTSGLSRLEAQALNDNGPFGDHLRRLMTLVRREQSNLDELDRILSAHVCSSLDGFYRLRSAGLIKGDSHRQVQLRCRLYEAYLGALLSRNAGSRPSLNREETH